MNIKSVGFSQIPFSAVIGPHLEQEMESRKKYITDTYSREDKREKKLKELDEARATISELLPQVDGSPVTVEIVARKKKNRRTHSDRLIFKYLLENENRTFCYETTRDEDNIREFVGYNKLISTLNRLSEQMKPWIKK